MFTVNILKHESEHWLSKLFYHGWIYLVKYELWNKFFKKIVTVYNI